MPAPPRIGEIGFLIHVECECGYYCGMPEGGTYPVCPHCGGRCVHPADPMSGDPRAESRKVLGYVTFLTGEQGALSIRYALQRWLGLLDDAGPVPERYSEDGRLYTEAEIRARSEGLDCGEGVAGEPYCSFAVPARSYACGDGSI